jgi:hypothetical protein
MKTLVVGESAYNLSAAKLLNCALGQMALRASLTV